MVDTQPLFLAAMESLLMGPPMLARVLTTSEPAAAMRFLDEGRVDLVVVEANGHVEELLGHAAAHGIPAILLLEGDDPESPAKALRAGVAGIFEKRTTPEEVMIGIQAVLAGHRAVAAKLIDRILDHGDGAFPVQEPPLSRTEAAILMEVATGKSVADIATSRGISQKTVRKHLANVYRKLHVRSRGEAVLWAAKMHLTGL